MQHEYPMVHPITFRQNPLVAHLASDPHWTVSDDEKRPVNARILLESGAVINAKPEDDPLVTLDKLDANENLNAVNRAYRLRARENRVMMIDVEPDAPESMKQHVLGFPGHYTELSKNGGVHVMIRVPDDCINDENRYMFDDLSVFKEPVPKAEDGKQDRGAYYEVLFNDHYVTFTKKMLTQKPCVDYNTDAGAKDALVKFLANIVNLDKQKKQEREVAKQFRIQLMDEFLEDEKEELVEKFLELKAFDKAREQADEKDITAFGGDGSRYEMSVANGLAYHVINTHGLIKDTISFKDMAAKLSVQDLVYAIYLLLKDAVPYREKHDEDRDNLPWLLFTSKRAFEYVKAQKSTKAKK